MYQSNDYSFDNVMNAAGSNPDYNVNTSGIDGQVASPQQQMAEILSYWKSFRVEQLQSDLGAYTNELNAEKKLQDGLTTRLKIIQRTLETETQVDSSTLMNMFDAFQSQITQLNNRVNLTEGLVSKLVNFFSIVINTSEATQKLTRGRKPKVKGLLDDLKFKPFTPLQTSTSAFANANNITSNFFELNKEIGLDSMSNSDTEGLDSFTQDENEEISVKTPTSSNAAQPTYALPYDLTDFKMPEHETTEDIARQLKDFLIRNKVSQKKFAESLLNMKQANFSSLMSQPLSWQTLTKTYRERFQIIYLWLKDPNRMEKLDNCSNKNLASLITFPSSSANVQNSTLNDEKKTRVFLNKQQTDRLKAHFIMSPYPSSDEIDTLAIELGLSTKRVASWFTNQRQINKNIIKKNSLM